jgi:maleylpyruvate isomerase
VNLTQSLAILEWLEERFPASPLLPITLEARRVIRTMAAIVACDIHPLNNLRVLQRLRSELNASETQVSEWIAQWVAEGFAALEEMIERHGDGFAYGDWPTLADCCIIPQVYSAERFGVDLAPYPQLRSVAAHAAEHPAFIAAHPSRQPGVR